MDMMTEVFNVGDKVECVRDSPDNNDSIAIGVQGVICVIVDSSPHIGVRWNEKVVGGHDCHGACSPGCFPVSEHNRHRAEVFTDGLLLPVILSALMTMTSLMLTQQSLTSSLNLSQGRPSHDGFGFYKSALFAGLSGR